MKIFKTFFITCLAILLSSCGFHLRGEIPLSPALKNVYIKTKTPYSDLTTNLKEYLKMSHVHIAESAASSTTVLELLAENSNQQLLGVNSTLQTRQYNLNLSVDFQITDPTGKILVPVQTVTETRTLSISSSQVLAGSNQAYTLTQDMRRAIIFDMMNVLSSNFTTVQLNKVKINP